MTYKIPTETAGSIDNQLTFLQLANGAKFAVQQALLNDQRDLNVQVAMRAINDLSAYLQKLNPIAATKTVPALNPMASVIWEILQISYSTSNAQDPLPSALDPTTLMALCNNYPDTLANKYANLLAAVSYLEGSGCSDFNASSLSYNGQTLYQALSQPSGAYQDMCIQTTAKKIGWPSYPPLITTYPDLYNTVYSNPNNTDTNSNYPQNPTIGTVAYLAAAIQTVITDLASVADGPLKVLYYYLNTSIVILAYPDPKSTLTLADISNNGFFTQGYKDLTEALAGTGSFYDDGVATPFYQLLYQCMDDEYGNAGKDIPNNSECSSNPGKRSSWYRVTCDGQTKPCTAQWN